MFEPQANHPLRARERDDLRFPVSACLFVLPERCRLVGVATQVPMTSGAGVVAVDFAAAKTNESVVVVAVVVTLGSGVVPIVVVVPVVFGIVVTVAGKAVVPGPAVTAGGVLVFKSAVAVSNE